MIIRPTHIADPDDPKWDNQLAAIIRWFELPHRKHPLCLACDYAFSGKYLKGVAHPKSGELPKALYFTADAVIGICERCAEKSDEELMQIAGKPRTVAPSGWSKLGDLQNRAA